MTAEGKVPADYVPRKGDVFTKGSARLEIVRIAKRWVTVSCNDSVFRVTHESLASYVFETGSTLTRAPE